MCVEIFDISKYVKYYIFRKKLFTNRIKIHDFYQIMHLTYKKIILEIYWLSNDRWFHSHIKYVVRWVFVFWWKHISPNDKNLFKSLLRFDYNMIVRCYHPSRLPQYLYWFFKNLVRENIHRVDRYCTTLDLRKKSWWVMFQLIGP